MLNALKIRRPTPRYYRNKSPRSHGRPIAVNLVPVPAVLPWSSSPSPRCYRELCPHYRGVTAVTAGKPWSPSPCSSVIANLCSIEKMPSTEDRRRTGRVSLNRWPWPMTLIFNRQRPTVIAHIVHMQLMYQGRRSVMSKVTVITKVTFQKSRPANRGRSHTHGLTVHEMVINKSVLNLVPRLSTWRYPNWMVSACAAYHAVSLSIDAAGARAQRQTSRMPLLMSIDGTDRRTDRRGKPDR